MWNPAMTQSRRQIQCGNSHCFSSSNVSLHSLLFPVRGFWFVLVCGGASKSHRLMSKFDFKMQKKFGESLSRLLSSLISQVSLALLSERCTVPSTCWWSWPRSTRLRCWQDSLPSWPSSLSGSSARPSLSPPWWSVRLELLKLLECAWVHVPCSQNEIFHLITSCLKPGIATVHLPFLRRNLYPTGGAWYRPGRCSDAKVEPLGERGQQAVHHCCGAQFVCCHTSAAHRLPHPTSRWHLSTQVAPPPQSTCIWNMHCMPWELPLETRNSIATNEGNQLRLIRELYES